MRMGGKGCTKKQKLSRILKSLKRRMLQVDGVVLAQAQSSGSRNLWLRLHLVTEVCNANRQLMANSYIVLEHVC